MESVEDDCFLEETDNPQNSLSGVDVGEDSKRDLLPSAIFMNNLRKQEYPCKYCSYVTTQDEDLRFHIKDVHKSQSSFVSFKNGGFSKVASEKTRIGQETVFL